MSGTAFGTIVLHVSPDAASGGPLAYVETGDRIRLSVKNKQLDLLVSEEDMARRKKSTKVRPAKALRGHDWLYRNFVTQAEEGCDFSFMQKAGLAVDD